MSDEKKKYDTAAYQRRWRAKQKMKVQELQTRNEEAYATSGITSTSKKLMEARLLIHQANVLIGEAPLFGIPQEAADAFATATMEHMQSLESRPVDVKMMYPAAKKISEIIRASNGFADIRISMLNHMEELLRQKFDGWEDAEKIDLIMNQMRSEFGGRN